MLAVVTALMTAFYMFRLMSMTFFGAYRGPAWEAQVTAPASAVMRRTCVAAGTASHPADPHAHGHAHEDDHEVSHGPAGTHAAHDAAAATDTGRGTGRTSRRRR